MNYLKARGLTQKDITVYCDSKSCVDELNNDYDLSITDLEKPESDIIKSIKTMARTFKTLKFAWVKGHQDDNDDTPFEQRPLPVRLSIACDKAAKECMRNCIKPKKRARPMEGAGATLYLGTNMVTTEMKEQIQYAAQVPQMKKYIKKRFRCTDEAFEEINWRALGRAKKRLKLHQSIRTSKMIYGWLNIGVQKRYMGQDSTCPCCGNATETQIHLYRCTNQKMRETLKTSIATVKSKLVQDGIPSTVYNPFIGEICHMAGVNHPDSQYDTKSERHKNEVQSQRQIMKEAILRGILHSDWTRKLHEQWKPRPPTKDGKKVHQKDAMEQTVSLIQAAWTIFENQWGQRNEILHGNENELLVTNKQQKFKRYMELRNNKYQMLRRCDHHMVEHPISDVIKWSRQHMSAILSNMEEMHKQYLRELKIEEEGLQPITAFFSPVN